MTPHGPTPAHRMAAGALADLESADGKVASGWRYDAQFERLADDPELLTRLGPAVRTALGHYLTAKRAAERLGADTRAPKGGTNR
jgi:hypothetical protein